MTEVSKLRVAFSLVNLIRSLPVWLCIQISPNQAIIEMDFQVWRDNLIPQMDPFSARGKLRSLNWILLHKPEYRNLLLHRFRKGPKTLPSVLAFVITRILWKPLESLYIETEDIGGGFFIQHGFSTIICAERLGENCWVNQQVTIGYTGLDCPVLEDNVVVNCGAKVLGGITMKKNSRAAAGAVVVKDVPENAIVGGVPARVIKYQE